MSASFTRWFRKGLVFLAVVCLPVSALAGGTWRTMKEDPTEDEMMVVTSEYTGDVTITFLGDCTLGGESPPKYPALSFDRRIRDNGVEFPFRELVRLTAEDDLTVANLEGVLTDRKLSANKKTFNFKGPASYTEILLAGSVECVTLANNHSHDYGEPGYRDTKAALESAGICWFGTDAPAVWQNSSGLRIGFLGVGYSLSAGYYETYKKYVKRLKDYGCAAIITFMHTGTEYSYSPPDNHQRQVTTRSVPYSDLIIGSHPHVPQGYTVLNGVPVVYSLGNCVFGGNTSPKDKDALVVRAVMHFTEGVLETVDLHFWPISVTSDSHYNNYSPRFLSGKDAERVLDKMRSSTGMDPGEWTEAEGAVVTFPVPVKTGQD